VASETYKRLRAKLLAIQKGLSGKPKSGKKTKITGGLIPFANEVTPRQKAALKRLRE
jgi:hypothetical protein